MYKKEFEKRKLSSVDLSRCLEDGGALSSALVPWATCEAYMATTLGVATLAYAPYAFVNIPSPITAII